MPVDDATTPPPSAPPPADQPGEPAFGPQQIFGVMNAALHLCQASGAFMAHGLTVAVIAIPHGRPDLAEVVATSEPKPMAAALEAVAAKVRKKYGAPGLVIPTPAQTQQLNGRLKLTEE